MFSGDVLGQGPNACNSCPNLLTILKLFDLVAILHREPFVNKFYYSIFFYFTYFSTPQYSTCLLCAIRLESYFMARLVQEKRF